MRFEAIRSRLDDLKPACPDLRDASYWFSVDGAIRTGAAMHDFGRQARGSILRAGKPEKFLESAGADGLGSRLSQGIRGSPLYTADGIAAAAPDAIRYDAELLVTTEKDRVNFPVALGR